METNHKASKLPLCGYILAVSQDPILLMVIAHHNLINHPNKAILPSSFNYAFIVSCNSVYIEEVVSLNHIPEGAEIVAPIEFLHAVKSPFIKAANELMKIDFVNNFLPKSLPDFGKLRVSNRSEKDAVIHSTELIGIIQASKVLCTVPEVNLNNHPYRVKLLLNAPLIANLLLQILKEAHLVLPLKLVEEASMLLIELSMTAEEKRSEE